MDPSPDYGATIPHLAFMIFQCMFAVITPALITGAFAERMKFGAFVLFTLLWATFVYNPLAHWVWGIGGWMSHMGALDFAGGTVVHISTGVSALAAALIIGKRLGYGSTAYIPHNLPMTVTGAALLWFGWFGFNAGSALACNGLAANAFVVTHVASAAAGIRVDLHRMDTHRETNDPWSRQRCRGRPGGHYPCIWVRQSDVLNYNRGSGRSDLLRRGHVKDQDGV